MSNSKSSLDYFKNLPPGASLDDIPWMEGDDEEDTMDITDSSGLLMNEVTGKIEAGSKVGVSTSGSIPPMPSMVDVHAAEEHNYALKIGSKQEDQIGAVPPIGQKDWTSYPVVFFVAPPSVNIGRPVGFQTDYEYEENGIESSVNVKDFDNGNNAGAEVIKGEPQTPDHFGFGLVTAAADGLEQQQINLASNGNNIQNEWASYPVVFFVPPKSVNTGQRSDTPGTETTAHVEDAQAQVSTADANANDFEIQTNGKAAPAAMAMAKPCVSRNISAMIAMESVTESEPKPTRSRPRAATAKTNTRVQYSDHWTCYHCEEKFTSWKEVREHMATIPDDLFRCRHCNEMIETEEDRKKHERMHTRKRMREEQEKCQMCEKSFSTREKLLTHLLDHTGENRFKCDLCPKKFRIESALKRHKSVHCGEGPIYACPFCSECFSSKRSLNTHEFTHIAARFGYEEIKRKKSKTGN